MYSIAEKADTKRYSLPYVVQVDRGLKKDTPPLKTDIPPYGRCLAVFKTEDDTFLAGVKTTGDRKCPELKGLSLDIDSSSGKEKVATENGDTVSELVPMSLKDLSREVPYQGRQWRFAFHPSLITVKVETSATPPTQVEDKFCAAIAMSDKERLTLGCDDCSSLKSCLESQLDSKKPLAIGDSKNSSTHVAGTSSDGSVTDGKTSADHATEPPSKADAKKTAKK